MKFRMSILMLLFIIALFPLQSINAQNLLNNPESVVYDSLFDRYLVSNWGDGSIVQIDNNGMQSYFDTTLSRIAGLHIIDSTLFVASNLEPYVGVYGFNLVAGNIVFSVDIPGTGLLNDLDSDTSGYLYVSDYYDHKIFKIDLENQSYSLFVESVLDWPNGILYDKCNNRLLAASVDAPGRPIHAVNLDDSTVSVAVYTNIYSIDGLAFDNEDRLYLSSWWSDAIHRYDINLSNPPEVFSSGHPDPADISVDKTNNILCIPNFYINRIDFVEIYPTSVADISIPDHHFTTMNYPNPFNTSTVIQYNLPAVSNVIIDIYDILGYKTETFIKQYQPAGCNRVTWNAVDIPAGIYIYKIQAGDYVQTNKMLLLK